MTWSTPPRSPAATARFTRLSLIPGSAVTLKPGHSASAHLRFSPDIPSRGEPGRGPCEPQAHKVRVLLGAPASGSLVGLVKPSASVCGRGSIQEQPLG